MIMAHVARCIVALCLFSLSPALSQQVTGSISGSVRDSSGLSLDHAPLRLVNTATGAEREAQSNESGDFVITSVDPGQYKLSVQAPGFKSFEKTGIVLTASERLSVGNLVLQLGDVSERITVEAQGTVVQTASAGRCCRAWSIRPGRPGATSAAATRPAST